MLSFVGYVGTCSVCKLLLSLYGGLWETTLCSTIPISSVHSGLLDPLGVHTYSRLIKGLFITFGKWSWNYKRKLQFAHMWCEVNYNVSLCPPEVHSFNCWTFLPTMLVEIMCFEKIWHFTDLWLRKVIPPKSFLLFDWHQVSEKTVLTNPVGAQALGKKFPASASWVI